MQCCRVKSAWMCAKSLQSCLTICNPMGYRPPGTSVHGILQAGILEWVAMPSSRGSSRSRDQTCVSHNSCIAGGFFTGEPSGKPKQEYLPQNCKTSFFPSSATNLPVIWCKPLNTPGSQFPHLKSSQRPSLTVISLVFYQLNSQNTGMMYQFTLIAESIEKTTIKSTEAKGDLGGSQNDVTRVTLRLSW